MFSLKRQSKLSEDLLSLPFDQYSRQYYVSAIIDTLARNVIKKKRLTVLDIGGFKGKTAEFQKQDKVLVADLFDEEYEGYVKVDGKSLPFDDDDFDVTVSFDTYEHVPRELRANFIDEALRVSSTVHILAAPFDDEYGTVYEAERLANETYKDLAGVDHRWLKEHLDYRTPSTKQFEEFCQEAQINCYKIRTNEIATWLMLQQFFFCAEIHSQTFSQVSEINTFYNKYIAEIESGYGSETTYRSIYCLSRDKSLIDALGSQLASLQPLNTNKDNPLKQSRLLQLNKLVADGYLLLKSS